MKRLANLVVLGCLIAGLTTRAEPIDSALLDSVVQSAAREGKKTIAVFYNPSSCMKCQIVIEKTLNELGKYSSVFRHVLIIEAPRILVAKNTIEKLRTRYACPILPDNGSYRARFKLPAGEPIWAVFSKSASLDAWGRLEDAGLGALRDSILQGAKTGPMLEKQSSVVIQEKADDPLIHPRINSSNQKYLAVSDRSVNHGFLIDRKTGEIAYELKVPKESVESLMVKDEQIYEGSLQNIVNDPIQLRHLHIVDDTTLLVFASISVGSLKFSGVRPDTVVSLHRIGIYGFHNIKTGKSAYKRVKGLRNMSGGYSSVLQDSMLYLGMSTGYRIKNNESDYSDFRMLVRINVRTGDATTVMEADSVYTENDLRGSYMISYLTVGGGKIYTVSSLSDAVHEVGTRKSFTLEQNPFVSQRELFRSLSPGKPEDALDKGEFMRRINAIPLKCQIENLTSLNDSVVAVAFTVSTGDLRNKTDSSKYYLQIINTVSGSCLGTILLPIDCGKGEALNGMVGGGQVKEGRHTFTVVVKTPENYRIDSYRIKIIEKSS